MRVILGGGAHPLHPPPRSAPGKENYFQIKEFALTLSVP